MRFKALHISILLLGFLMIFSACRKEPSLVDRGDVNSFSTEQQINLGEKITESIYSNPTTYPILDRNQYRYAYEYLQESILNVAVNTQEVSRRKDFDWKVTIIHDDDDRNAFIVPGGELFIYTGLLKFLESNSELMGVVAHEIAYADGELAVENLRSQFAGSELRGIIDGTDMSKLNDIAEYFQIIQYNRDAVVHADSFAINLLCPFNYDPSGLKEVLERPFTGDFNWLLGKTYDAANRIALIDEVLSTKDCGNGRNLKLTEEYEQFKQYLP